MVSTTGTRPNHYETLGLTPSASADEIDRAYGREIMKPRVFGGLAQVSMAYATLKDAAKRRAYDASIGLVQKPEPKPLHASWSWSVHVPAPANPAAGVAAQPPLTSVADSKPEPAPQPAESPLAASLRELADPAPIGQAQRLGSAPIAPPPPTIEPRIQQPIVDLPDAEPVAVEWRRPALVGGGLLLAAVMFGAWAGVAVRDPGEPAEPQARVTMPVPSARARSASAASLDEAPEARLADTLTLQLAQSPVRDKSPGASASARSSVPRPIRLTPQEEQELAGGAFAESATAQASEAAQAMAEVPADAAVPVSPARLPLPERTVARTIGRIGYACGSVASVISVDGAAGVFKVTCSSGHSYQARPVRGRYHFRRWGG